MQYIKVQFDDGSVGFQEVFNGYVQRFTDLDGVTINPVGGSAVIDSNPTMPTWAQPDPTPTITAPQATLYSKLDFMQRFVEPELENIYTAAKSVVAIEIWLDKFKLAEFIDVTDPDTIIGIHALESAGLLGEGRASEILGA